MKFYYFVSRSKWIDMQYLSFDNHRGKQNDLIQSDKATPTNTRKSQYCLYYLYQKLYIICRPIWTQLALVQKE